MKRVPRTAKSSQRSNGNVRVIAGQWRGRKLPVADVAGLRPTTDRNKETLFNWLMQDVADARCLDVFAGSGGLGIEALSRYAAHCVFIERDKQVAGNLRNNLATLGASADVLNGDALSLLPGLASSFDLIFVDPPFHRGLVGPTLDAVFQQQLLVKGGKLYLEQEASAPMPELPADYQILRHKQSAQLSYCLIARDG